MAPPHWPYMWVIFISLIILFSSMCYACQPSPLICSQLNL
ncbi:hypothetical protein Pint_30815 [Pistacia integerrima]|uniref:Uncharacterized protein n=1 Tax=Pistacia integerrima TaxID=434235 RepID=A0ACC0X0I7_9ROSI|nr:hypothetical protein Pint_30815 [Pistacia integerrima]